MFTIGILFLLVQTAFLILTFSLMSDIEKNVATFIDWFTDRGVYLPPSTVDNGTLTSFRATIIKVRLNLRIFDTLNFVPGVVK